MKNALIAVAITALMGGLVIAPVTQQSAEAQVYGGLKAARHERRHGSARTTSSWLAAVAAMAAVTVAAMVVVMAAAIGVVAAAIRRRPLAHGGGRGSTGPRRPSAYAKNWHHGGEAATTQAEAKQELLRP